MKETWSTLGVMNEIVQRINDMTEEKKLSIEVLVGALGCIYELEKARFVTETMQAAASLGRQDEITATLEKLLGKHKPD